MALIRPAAIALGVAGAFALTMPLALLTPGARVAEQTIQRDAGPVIPPPVPAIGAAYQRPLFAPAEGIGDAPADAPALTGIAGRLNRDAVALVRIADGSARTLAIGQSVDGWRLESLAIDAAFFTRGRERVRVAIETGDAEPEAEE